MNAEAPCLAAMDPMPASGSVLTIELNMGQMVHDVKYAAEGSREVGFHGTAGGIVRSPDQVAKKIRATVGRTCVA